MAGMENREKFFQDESGQWWYRLPHGRRTRADIKVCEVCGREWLVRRSGSNVTGRYCSRLCANRAVKPRRHLRGSEHWNWKGGRHVRKQDGYVTVTTGERKWQLEHRLVMAQHLGRDLYPHETVHHLNGDKADNRIENLELRVGRHGKGATEAHCSTCTCFS
jgi:hypothetical protein